MEKPCNVEYGNTLIVVVEWYLMVWPALKHALTLCLFVCCFNSREPFGSGEVSLTLLLLIFFCSF